MICFECEPLKALNLNTKEKIIILGLISANLHNRMIGGMLMNILSSDMDSCPECGFKGLRNVGHFWFCEGCYTRFEKEEDSKFY